MAVVHVLLLFLSMVAIQPSNAEVDIMPYEQYDPPFRGWVCWVRNESFVGWFKADDNIKIPMGHDNRVHVKEVTAVVIELGTENSTFDTFVALYYAGVDARSAVGKYVCKGTMNQKTTVVNVTLDLSSLQTTQVLHLGTNGTITLSAFTYPLSRFTWRKDKVPIDFDKQDRLRLKDDGSIEIFNVQKSDAGVYDVEINYKNKVVKDVYIKVSTKIDSEVFVPFSEVTLYRPFSMSIICYIKNERFIGWFKEDSNISIPVVPSRPEVKAEPAVVVASASKTTKKAWLIFPRGTPASNAGRYVCKGQFHRAGVKVITQSRIPIPRSSWSAPRTNKQEDQDLFQRWYQQRLQQLKPRNL